MARLAEETIDPRYRTLVLTAAYWVSGIGELFALRRGVVDTMRATLDVAETLVEVRGHQSFGPPKTLSRPAKSCRCPGS